MPGFFGFSNIKNSKIDDIKSSIELYPNQIFDKSYTDDNIVISGVKLKFSNNEPLVDSNYVIYINGRCYNLKEINKLFNLNADSFEEVIKEAYKNNMLDTVLSKINGFFQIILYDKTNKKINLISDRHGLWYIYYYLKNNQFIFASEVKEILYLKDIDTTINDKAFSFFMDLGYLPGDNTWFEHIKLIKPSTILEYDIDKKELSQRYYWDYSKINQLDISYDEAVEQLSNLFISAVLSGYKEADTISIPLSGGVDSRMIVSAFDKLNIKLNMNLITMGEDGCLDIKIAKMIAKKLKQKHKIVILKSDDLIKDRKNLAWKNDGLFSIMHMHGGNNINKYPKDVTTLFSGAIGGEIFGCNGRYTPKEQYYNLTITKEIIRPFYGNQTDNLEIDYNYYNTPHFLPYILDNTLRKFTFASLQATLRTFIVVVPFMDNNILDFIFSIPDSYKKSYRLYLDALKKAFPKFYKNIPLQNPIQYSIENAFQRYKRLFVRNVKKVFHIPNQTPLFDYPKYVKEEKNQEQLKEILEKPNMYLYQLNNDFISQYYKEKYDLIKYNADMMLKLVTVKLYFDKVEEVLK